MPQIGNDLIADAVQRFNGDLATGLVFGLSKQVRNAESLVKDMEARESSAAS